MPGYKEPLPVSILIVTNAFKSNISEVLRCYSPKLVVFDSSVSRRKIKEWKALLDDAKIPYHDVKEKGAYVLDIH